MRLSSAGVSRVRRKSSTACGLLRASAAAVASLNFWLPASVDATAIARVDDAVHDGLPIFRLRSDGTEKRVRVREIRERTVR